LWFISRPCQYLRLYSLDGRKIGECGIGKDLERRSYMMRYSPNMSEGTEEINEKSK
jgi:hypothetical protein